MGPPLPGKRTAPCPTSPSLAASRLATSASPCSSTRHRSRTSRGITCTSAASRSRSRTAWSPSSTPSPTDTRKGATTPTAVTKYAVPLQHGNGQDDATLMKKNTQTTTHTQHLYNMVAPSHLPLGSEMRRTDHGCIVSALANDLPGPIIIEMNYNLP